MSAAPASSAPPTTKATTTDKNVEPKDTKPAAALEEDDEFEDFPVESESFRGRSQHLSYMAAELVLTLSCLQTGHKKRLKYQEIIRICGRRAGMTMILVKTSRHS